MIFAQRAARVLTSPPPQHRSSELPSSDMSGPPVAPLPSLTSWQRGCRLQCSPVRVAPTLLLRPLPLPSLNGVATRPLPHLMAALQVQVHQAAGGRSDERRRRRRRRGNGPAAREDGRRCRLGSSSSNQCRGCLLSGQLLGLPLPYCRCSCCCRRCLAIRLLSPPAATGRRCFRCLGRSPPTSSSSSSSSSMRCCRCHRSTLVRPPTGTQVTAAPCF